MLKKAIGLIIILAGGWYASLMLRVSTLDAPVWFSNLPEKWQNVVSLGGYGVILEAVVIVAGLYLFISGKDLDDLAAKVFDTDGDD